MNKENSFMVVGYYRDRMTEEQLEKGIEAGDVFVALFDDDNGYYCYCPIGQHSDLDYDYLEECEEITEEEYIAISKHLYTPKDYLKGVGVIEG